MTVCGCLHCRIRQFTLPPMPDLTRTYRPDVHCLKRQAWAYGGGICLQPVSHDKKCRFVWSEGIKVRP